MRRSSSAIIEKIEIVGYFTSLTLENTLETLITSHNTSNIQFSAGNFKKTVFLVFQKLWLSLKNKFTH